MKTQSSGAVISMEESQTNQQRQSGGLSIRAVGVVTIGVAIALAFFSFSLAGRIANVESSIAEAERRYAECSSAIDDLQRVSDYLTTQARMFVVLGNRDYMDAYVYEVTVAGRRDKSVDVLKANLNDDLTAVSELEAALEASNGLAKSELAAMRLAADYYNVQDLPSEVATANIDMFRTTPDGEAKLASARQLVFDDNYNTAKETILSKVESSSDALLLQLNSSMEENESLMQGLLFQLRVSVALLLCVIMVFVLALFLYVLKPLSHYVERLSAGEPLTPDGAFELHYLAHSYNVIYEDNNKRIEQLREHAEQDPLTGISNRAGYDSFLATHTRNIALLLIDVDDFREFNTVYGHDTGDEVLIKLAEALVKAFRLTDFPCRIEGDLFAVIMTNMNTELRHAILNKIDMVNSILADDEADLPAVTISVGAAFSTEGMNDKDIYRAASAALTQAKQVQSNSVVFYGETAVEADEE